MSSVSRSFHQCSYAHRSSNRFGSDEHSHCSEVFLPVGAEEIWRRRDLEPFLEEEAESGGENLVQAIGGCVCQIVEEL